MMSHADIDPNSRRSFPPAEMVLVADAGDERPRPDVCDQRRPRRADLVSHRGALRRPAGSPPNPELTVTVADVEELADLLRPASRDPKPTAKRRDTVAQARGL